MRNAEQSARLLATMAGANPSKPSAQSGSRGQSPRRPNQPWLPTEQQQQLLNGPSMLGGAMTPSAAPPSADPTVRMSLPERIRRTTAKAVHASAHSKRPAGLNRMESDVHDSVFKGRYRPPVPVSAGPGLGGRGAGNRRRPPSRGGSQQRPSLAAPHPPPASDSTSRPASSLSVTSGSAPGSQAGASPWPPTQPAVPGLAIPQAGHYPSAAGKVCDSALPARAFTEPSPGTPQLSIERQLQMGRDLSSMHATALQEQLRCAPPICDLIS